MTNSSKKKKKDLNKEILIQLQKYTLIYSWCGDEGNSSSTEVDTEEAVYVSIWSKSLAASIYELEYIFW